MMISLLKNSKLILISAILVILQFSLITPANAQSSYRSSKYRSKLSALKNTENRSLKLNLILARSIARQDESLFSVGAAELVSDGSKEIVPMANSTLIASVFGGRASWYGPGFHGRLTANGERYNQYAMTAAHKTLRFGTRVQVTNLNNGRSVVVRINDRGPYIKGRVIDVSAAAANSLGMIHSGVVPVRVRILR